MKRKSELHLRRCHLCGEISQRDGETVNRCENCGKSMAPFYYFDDFSVNVYSEDRERPPKADGEPFPVRGLTAVW